MNIIHLIRKRKRKEKRKRKRSSDPQKPSIHNTSTPFLKVLEDIRNGCYRTEKLQTLENPASLGNQNLPLPAADERLYKAAVTTATVKLLIKDIWAGLAPVPTALYMIGLNWSAQVNFVQEV